VRDRIEFQRAPTLYRLVVDDFSFDAPVGLEAFTDAVCEAFPSEAAGVRKFVGLCVRYFDEIRQMPVQLAMDNLDDAVERFPTVFAHRTETAGAVLDRCVKDERCRAALTAIWQYLGLPPARLAFEIYARFFMTLRSGLYHVVGGFQQVADAFVASLESSGGEFLPNANVTSVRIANNAVRGVTIGDEIELEAPVIVSNADARQTFEQLIGLEYLPASFQRRLQRLRPSASMFAVYAAASLELETESTPFQTIVYSSFDLDAAYDAMMAGRPDAVQVVVPSLHDDAFAPEGEHLIVAASLAPYDLGRPWPDAKAAVENRVLAMAERALPGMRAQLTHVESATPLVLERYTLNFKGAASGWENAPDQPTSRRLPYVTPIDGLYLASQWTQAGSALRVMVSGTHAAQIVLRRAGVEDVGPDF
jgi:phytoene dehydrogenase-like protein